MPTTHAARASMPALLDEAQRLLAEVCTAVPETALTSLLGRADAVLRDSDFKVRLGLVDPTASQPAQPVAFVSLCSGLVHLSDATARWHTLQTQLHAAAELLPKLRARGTPTDDHVRCAEEQRDRLRFARVHVTAAEFVKFETLVLQWEAHHSALAATKDELARRDGVYKRVAVEVAAAHAALRETCEGDAAARAAFRAQHGALFACVDARLRTVLEQQPVPLAPTLYDAAFIPGLVPLDGVLTQAAEEARARAEEHKREVDEMRAQKEAADRVARELNAELEKKEASVKARDRDLALVRNELAVAQDRLAQLRAELHAQERELIMMQQRVNTSQDMLDCCTQGSTDSDASTTTTAFANCFVYDKEFATAIPYSYVRGEWVKKVSELNKRVEALKEENEKLKSQSSQSRSSIFWRS